MAFSLWYLLLFLAAQGTIPFLIGYFQELSELKKGREPKGKRKEICAAAAVLTFFLITVVVLLYVPPLEELAAGVYVFALMTLIVVAFLILGRWGARSDYRRKQKKNAKAMLQ